jgi:hypothetical protein
MKSTWGEDQKIFQEILLYERTIEIAQFQKHPTFPIKANEIEIRERLAGNFVQKT